MAIKLDRHDGFPREDLLSGDLDTMAEMIELSQSLASAPNLQSLMDVVHHGARALTGSDGATFVLRDGDQCYYADEDAIQPLWKGKRFPVETCVSGWVMENHTTLVIPDIYQDTRVPISIYEPTFVRSLAIVPIRTSNPLGAIGSYWSMKHQASPFEVRLLQILANMTATAMENLNHERELIEKATQLATAFEGTLRSLARITDLRDSYTAGHQHRVGEVASYLGRAMGLEEDRCQFLYWAGMVHDVGKIAIPTEILSKPTRLSPIELEMIRTHPKVGSELLQGISMNFPIDKVILQHHERLDGTGYPDGLCEVDIIEDARILAVADVFEAMVSYRPYRPACGYDAALDELDKHRGILYDSAIVDTLIRLVREEGYRIEYDVKRASV